MGEKTQLNLAICIKLLMRSFNTTIFRKYQFKDECNLVYFHICILGQWDENSRPQNNSMILFSSGPGFLFFFNSPSHSWCKHGGKDKTLEHLCVCVTVSSHLNFRVT